MYSAIRMLLKRPQNHRKIIVVISESQNNGSRIGLGESLRTAQLYDIMIYPVRLSTLSARLRRKPEQRRDPIPPGVIVRPTMPGAAATPTTLMQSRFSITPNVIPIVIDLVRGVKNLVFNNPLEVLADGTGGIDFSPRTSSGRRGVHHQDRRGYPQPVPPDLQPRQLNEKGIYHRIEVKTPYDRLKVRHRVGYFHGPNPMLDGEPVEPLATRAEQ